MLVKTDYDAFLKQYWDDAKLETLIYKNRPFLAMCPKDEDFGGQVWIIPMEVDYGADGSPTFSDAQATAAASGTDIQAKQFQVSAVEDFQVAQLSNKLRRLSRKTPQLALENAANLTKQKMDILAQRIARSMYRSGYGEVGTISASTVLTTSVINLTNKIDARNFRIGMPLVFAASLTAALRNSGAFVRVTKVDFDNANITTDAPTNLQTSITGIAVGDVIFLKGARGTGASPALLTIQGLAAWIPDVAPTTGDSFNGQDRSVWPDRMAGLRYPATGTIAGPIQEILLDSLVDGAIREAYFDRGFMDPKKYGEALKALGDQVLRSNEKIGRVGFNGFEVQIGYGSGGVKIFPDANCPTNYQYNVTLDTWQLPTAGPLIQNDLLTDEARDVENASAIEYRYVFCGAFGTNAPGKNQVVKYT